MTKADFIKDIQSEAAYWLGFELTTEQVKEYLKDNPKVDCFDTMEREDLGYYLSKKITGLNWPMYGDDQAVKDKFWESLKENAPKFGYKLL